MIEQPNEEHHDDSIQYGPHLPDTYLKVIPHPKSVNQASLIIPLVGNFHQRIMQQYMSLNLRIDLGLPFVPWRTLK